ncbi:hypothetical protein [Desulfonatronum thiodismutans]|uniref:hypothetical protein n=1 Tax=Desulfonatronum thiodismutans TaxID=159290 RepID=UPI0004ABE25B|nr:hypothetical protein [Desulfonatronum thiodismutans]
MARITMYRIQINTEAIRKGEPIAWVHDGRQWISTANQPQAGLLLSEEIESIRKLGFQVDLLEEFIFDDLK